MSVGYHMPSRDEIEAQIRAEQAFADAQAEHAEGACGRRSGAAWKAYRSSPAHFALVEVAS